MKTEVSTTELARLREQEAGAAAMRQTLEWIQSAEKRGTLNYCGSVSTRRAVDASLESTAGRDLLAEVERLRAALKPFATH